MKKNKKWKECYKRICFIEEDFEDIDKEHDNPMVISALMHNFLVKRILIDQGSSVDILYLHVIEAMGITRSMYKSYGDALVGFARGQVQVEGTIAS